MHPTPECAWFDPATGAFRLDETVAEMASFRKIMADGRVTEQEYSAQAQLVSQCMRELEAALPPEIKSIATRAICELAVLQTIQGIASHPSEAPLSRPVTH